MLTEVTYGTTSGEVSERVGVASSLFSRRMYQSGARLESLLQTTREAGSYRRRQTRAALAHARTSSRLSGSNSSKIENTISGMRSAR